MVLFNSLEILNFSKLQKGIFFKIIVPFLEFPQKLIKLGIMIIEKCHDNGI